MARVTVEDCLEKLDNRFALVLLVSKRAKQLLKGAAPTVSARGNKYIVNSLREVASGSVHFNIHESEGSMKSMIEKDLKK
jgi:DNA-directed RNA polymerase subunit omega